ncbi:cytochrome P450 [uncultured Maritimibacter sp.]|jgi:cytochrome P450|uniref:cytochrome P450 n=1 Tax=uncultured Maritimibacter sp. TaxID=991866 RepID=UPI002636CCF7|nr:cytochrome P450 [uncultured Maritimibacter sp.]
MRKLKSWFGAGRKPAPVHVEPALPLDLTDPAFLADPAPIYAWLRENAPLAPVASGGYLLTRAAEIEAAFTDPRLGNAPSRFSMLAGKNRDRYTAAAVAGNIPPFLDKPRHVAIRKPLSAAFYDTLSGAEAWLPALARDMLPPGPFEIIADYARPYASAAMAQFIGLPPDIDAMARASAALFKLFAPITDRAGFQSVNDGLDASRAMILAALERAKAAPGHDLLSHLRGTESLSDTEIADNALLVLADGIENIEAAIANVQLLRARFPEAEGTPAQIVDEALRYETPAQTIPRVVRESHERDGVTLAEGTPVFLALGSANRDPVRFADPDRFWPERDPSGTLSFGLGRHRCIGAPLGRMLVISATEALIDAGCRVTQPAGALSFHPRMGHRWPMAVTAQRAGRR